MNRRGFFQRTIGALIGAVVLKRPAVKFWRPSGAGLLCTVVAAPTTTSVAGIERATFKFWRNQQQHGPSPFETRYLFDRLREERRK